jgi:hypothetical protein
MDYVVSRLGAVFAYMDDSKISFPGKQTNLVHLEVLFAALATNGLAINLEKCVFAVPTLEILDHTVSAAGRAPTARHTAEIDTCPPPRISSNCKVFLAW